MSQKTGRRAAVQTAAAIGVTPLAIFLISASAPMTVTGGGIPAAIATTGSTVITLVFPLIAVVLGLFVVGYAALSRHVTEPGGFYAYITKGLGRAPGVSGAFLAMTAYATVQWALYGLFGGVMAAFAATIWGWNTSWVYWSLLCWLIVSICGVRRLDLSKIITIGVVIFETAAVIAIVIAAFMEPAGGTVKADALDPAQLLATGAVAVTAMMTMACMIGFEGGPAFSAEIRSVRTISRATSIALAVLSGGYSVITFALTVAGGNDPDNGIVALVRNPESGFPFSVVAAAFGDGIATTVNVALLTSVFAAALTFHNIGARYAHPLGQDRVLPALFGYMSPKTQAPLGGSLAQSAMALIVVLLAHQFKLDPVLGLFTWASYVTALALLFLLIGTSFAVIAFFRRNANLPENTWRRAIAPALSIVLLSALVLIAVSSADLLLGEGAPTYLRYLLPGAVPIVAVAGYLWGLLKQGQIADRVAGATPVDADTYVISADRVEL